MEVTESRSDDDTTCSASCYSSSVAPSESEEEVRDGGEETTFIDQVDSKDNKELYSDDECGPPDVGRTAHGEPSNHRSTGAAGDPLAAIPESIPEEVEPVPSAEDSELSAGSKETETTEETLDVSYGSSSTECSSKDGEVIPTGSNSDARENGSDAEEDEDIVNVPSDDAVIATTTSNDNETSVKVEKDPTDSDGRGPRTKTTEIADADYFAESSLQNEKDGLALARQQWAEAMATLQKNPALMTSDILELALQHRAPLHVVRFMVGLNPDAAGVPRSGPSALQVAVR